MELYIAGGCREHGCNCFLIRGSRYYILLDCGEGLGNTPQLPSLLKEDIEKIRYIFLSHSHRAGFSDRGFPAGYMLRLRHWM